MNHSGSFSQGPQDDSGGAAAILHIPHALSWHEDSAFPAGSTPFLPQDLGGALLPQDLSLVSEGHSD